MRPRGKQVKVSLEELARIIEMKKTMPAKQVSRITGRSMLVVVYADKPRPEPKKKADMFNYRERENWLI